MEAFAIKSIEFWLNELKEVGQRYKSNQITREDYEAYITLIETQFSEWLGVLHKINDERPRGEGLWRVPFLI